MVVNDKAGCVVCGAPRSSKGDITDRCGHHRRQLQRTQAKATGLPSPVKQRIQRAAPSPLELAAPSDLKDAHRRGAHKEHRNIACVLCIHDLGGRLNNVEMLVEPPSPKD